MAVDLDAEFEAERGHLMAVAHRMLGSRSEAEDAVQETWLRYAAALADPAARAQIRDLRAWLTTTCSRICLDVLRSARVRREAYPGQWLPEPVVRPVPTADGFAPDPAERAVRADQVGTALLVVLERLAPEQRVAFVLHDVFAVPFATIAEVLGTTPAAARQLASRARRAVTAPDVPRHTADLAEQRRVLTAFAAAVESGELDRLVQVLAPDVVLIGDSGGHFPAARRPVVGADAVARFILGLFGQAGRYGGRLLARPALVDGALGWQAETVHRDGRPIRLVTAFAVHSGRITGVFNQLNPEKVRDLPPLGAEETWPLRW
ncbi:MULTISPECIES: RNA polymerase sigma factor SigJ [Micromonospora]|jgi:RNA polymerase sigma-70 factor (ECF subfamily)|uniref:RNA polymerase sigma factor SigJ n=1 Tax=Micromonospora sicca TaxID=2202420 RepID=A0A317DNF3_9ACTN|nr:MULTISPECIES: RNA polymerase sigma factor SigJ [unclassified Micromonospora]MBM0228726.1 RNA polymerase sigma factor SigJ [Micromonospora sp. ATA51]MDZ5441367.1 RNA polymerase sigma factor SigJ [Micromonospora sp. 4G57]MDZ5493800.1 RNA polymerase sigma factor SigJ [Micromonospora sp. 4G53]PWR15902.1 RNA polymerase subunit sigma-70 [Micromonospora sp. 4G51]